MKYTENKSQSLSEVGKEILQFWKENDIFEKSISEREGNPTFVFYEGPPSANGTPGIHHVMARAVKDIFCRYKTQKGFQVKRKGGWDTHGLPVELQVEKELGITKVDIGKKITVEEYNRKCREAVMKFKNEWDEVTEKMGYWVDLDDPYITFDKKYIESVWYLLKELYKKDFLYKGKTIQPYSPAAGTGLSSHELNQPGTYRDVKDTSCIAQFKIKNTENDYFIAWTTTPWTLPSNTALAVGHKIDYVKIRTFNQYTGLPVHVILAKGLVGKYFTEKGKEVAFDDYQKGDKNIPWDLVEEYKGKDLLGMEYEQLMPYALPYENPENAFVVIAGDFVTIEDGTGIVHIAPTFGADDAMVAKVAGVPPMLVLDENGDPAPLVDLQGKFRPEMGEFGGLYVKNEYYKEENLPDKSADVLISIKLKEENKAFKVEKYEHSYPHCWRTDKPILYYPLDSWFIKTTAVKDKLIANNKKINWKPASTGTGRFGNWLENLQDWNLSRSRYWGTPLPIWRTEDGKEEKCIGTLAELDEEVAKSVKAGFMDQPLSEDFDLHRPFVDDVYLVSDSGEKMVRELDLIDVWFDSGAMPYAQNFYKGEGDVNDMKWGFPADFIAEGVDQTRGWFFTLHAIGTMLYDSVAFKNVIANGLVLDKKGNKMSKRHGNAVDPFETIEKYGPDATRWYMITNAQPWDNLKFDIAGIEEVQRRFFGTLKNTYLFFALYANLDDFTFSSEALSSVKLTESDRWVISKLNSLIKAVDKAYSEYEPTRAGRLIQDFTIDDLSNWYVRLNRKRFWKSDSKEDKEAAYQTLYTCLDVISRLSAPIAPFYAEKLFQDLNKVTGKLKAESVHLADFPVAEEGKIDSKLEERMAYAQNTSSLVHSLRRKESIKVRQPLSKIMIPSTGAEFETQLTAVADLIKTEINVKEIEFMPEDSEVLVKNIKPNFAKLGKVFGRNMKTVAQQISEFSQEDIRAIEKGEKKIQVDGQEVILKNEDVEITSQDIPGLLVASEQGLTVALDVTITEELKNEGIARELVNRIQNLRKDKGLEVQDRINITIKEEKSIVNAVQKYKEYICLETQADTLKMEAEISNADIVSLDTLELELLID